MFRWKHQRTVGLSRSVPPYRAVSRKGETRRKRWRTSRKPLQLGCGLRIRRRSKRLDLMAPPSSLPSEVYSARMARLANISGKEAVKAFSKAGWQVMGQVGSHVVLSKPDVRANLSVPQHKELSTGTLRALIRAAGMTVEQFLALL